jgi:DnaJ homolog subfamily C member 28
MTTPTTSLSFWVYRRCTRSLSSAGRAASAKLWEDAAREEAEQASAPSNTVNLQVQQDKPWTGEESTSDAVLRMLVDKYKPLRSGRIQTAEEKLHSTQKASVSSAPIPATTPGSSDVKPWMVTFTPPKLTPSIKHANIPKSRGTSARSADQSGYDFQELKRLKRVKEIDRVTTARERTLDYRIGRGAAGSQGGNPLTLKGWANLVEDQIEVSQTPP